MDKVVCLAKSACQLDWKRKSLKLSWKEKCRLFCWTNTFYNENYVYIWRYATESVSIVI